MVQPKGSIPWNKGIHTGQIPWNKGTEGYGTGVNNGNWKGGVAYKNGYRYLLMPGHPRATMGNGRYAPEHIIIYEQHFGPLPDDYIVHHINGDKLDNRIENLKAMTRAEHKQIHKIGLHHSEETKKKIREHHNPKSNMNRPKGWHHSVEARLEMTKSRIGKKRGHYKKNMK